MVNRIRLRPAQERILSYQGGKMGISAVPGSGKTWTLSYLAADIIQNKNLTPDEEVLIVTLVNSAVDNFGLRIGSFLQQAGLLPGTGYRVRTLHGLANDILRESPGLVGLEDNYQIIDEREAETILTDISKAWLSTHSLLIDHFLNPDLEASARERVPISNWLDLVKDIAVAFIRTAKDRLVTPETLEEHFRTSPGSLPLLEMGLALFRDYQRALMYRGGVDFDDLIRLALQALRSDKTLLQRLRNRWPVILEDEAQDSSHLQEEILRLLVGEDGSWVRVGDPNQAIYETFTTASPRFLRNFLLEDGVISRELPESGRSCQKIINLANWMIEWVQQSHPAPEVRDALSPPLIQPTSPDDPQPNPADADVFIHLSEQKFSPAEEIVAVVKSLENWLPNHPEQTVAVLTPRNQRGFEVVDALRQKGIEYVDSLLRSSSSTRFSAGAIAHILKYLSDPQSSSKLANVYKVWRRNERDTDKYLAQTEKVSEMIRKVTHVEDYLWPGAEFDWFETLDANDKESERFSSLIDFRDQVRRWQSAVMLPIDQLVLVLAQDLFQDPADLAIAYKLAGVLRRRQDTNPSWRLPDLGEELASIARNERRFIGFSEDDSGFDPDHHRGKVVVATMHKAKGLEWDRVYLMSVNNYDFPSGDPFDQYIAEKWFIRDRLNLPVEALAQLEAVLSRDEYHWYQEGAATLQARLDYIRERLRLFFVAITRARKELIITWNSGRDGRLIAARPLLELTQYWKLLQEPEKNNG
jgi:DNA helicase-2/ATP-dependent DNA helicase PcrA